MRMGVLGVSNLGGGVHLTSCSEPGRERGKNVLATAFQQASSSSATWGCLRERGTRPQLPDELHISEPRGQCYLCPSPHPVTGGVSRQEQGFDKLNSYD